MRSHMHDTRTHAERVSDDFWGWFGPKVDEWDRERTEQIASMPERTPETASILGTEALDIEFEPVSQVLEPTQAHAIRSRLMLG